MTPTGGAVAVDPGRCLGRRRAGAPTAEGIVAGAGTVHTDDELIAVRRHPARRWQVTALQEVPASGYGLGILVGGDAWAAVATPDFGQWGNGFVLPVALVLEARTGSGRRRRRGRTPP